MKDAQDPKTHVSLSPQLAPLAEAAFVGRLLEVGPEPTFLSGDRRATQDLVLEVVRVLKGPLTVAARVTVRVGIVGGARHVARGAAGLPALDREVFKPGRLFVIYATASGDLWSPLPGGEAIEPLG